MRLRHCFTLPEPRETPDEDLFLAMHVYLELELRQAAAKTAERCREALRHATDEHLKSTLVEALGARPATCLVA